MLTLSVGIKAVVLPPPLDYSLSLPTILTINNSRLECFSVKRSPLRILWGSHDKIIWVHVLTLSGGIKAVVLLPSPSATLTTPHNSNN